MPTYDSWRSNLLPFLKNNIKNQTGVMVKQRQPDESAEPKEHDLESMVKQAIEHYKASDFKQLASCIKDIIQHCESNEESEGNDFHSQNEKAAKEQE